MSCSELLPNRELTVILERSDILGLNKPSGLAIHRARGVTGPTVVSELARLGYGQFAPAHRLDRGTSGAMVAVTKQAAAALAEQFAQRRVHKSYLALVRGEAPARLHLDYAIPSDEGGPRVEAVTDLVCLQTVTVDGSELRERRYSIVRAVPHTGRFHQVRRHLKHLGHPLVGDKNYGRSEHDRLCQQRFGLTRLALHCEQLSFSLPHAGTTQLLVNLPDDFREPLQRMGFDVEAFLGSCRLS